MSRRAKRNKRISVIVIIVIVLVVSVALYFLLSKGTSTKKTNVVEEISGYSYTLDDRDTIYMRTTFRELKSVLKDKNLNFEKYAEYLAKLYIIDLYTINNKSSKYDVGGFEYVHPDGVDNFKLQVGDTMYKYIGSDDLPKKDLPEVTNVEITDIKEATYTYNDKEYPAYTMNASWTYKKDLGYDTKASMTLMKDDKMLYVVECITEAE